MQGRKGFTLIELLVVIAIIAILAAILFPVFAQARAKARGASCLSNVKQLALGFTMYAQDYDESFPQWQWDKNYNPGGNPNVNNGKTVWFNAIYPYVKNAQVYTCPDTNYHINLSADSNPGDNAGSWGWFDFHGGKDPQIDKALWNVPISYGTSEPLTYSFPRLASQDRPAETLIVADMITALSGWDGWGDYDPNNANNPKNNERNRRWAYPNGSGQPWFWNTFNAAGPFDPAWDKYARHSNGNNIGFADGHAKWRPASRCTIDLYGVLN